MLGECGMTAQDKQTLKKNSVALFRDMVVDELLIQILQADDVLTESMAEGILAEPTSFKKSSHLLSLLPKRGPRAFNSFCAALRDTKQKHLCEMLMRFRDQECSSTESEGEICFTQASASAHSKGNCERHRGSEGDGRRERGIQFTVSVSDEEKQDVETKGTFVETRSTQRFHDPTLPLPTQECAVPAKRTRTHESIEMCLDADSPVTTAVQPCTPEFYLSHCVQAYPMCSSPRGLALVVSNVRFEPELSELDTRRGGEVDEEVLRRLFTEMDFTVSLYKDLSVQGMRGCIEQFVERPEHSVSDCCVVCLLSHGVEGSIYGSDGQLLELDWVFERFDNAHCPVLQNKPKMFFIQACRGEEMDRGVDQLDGDDQTRTSDCEQRDAGRDEKSERRSAVMQENEGERLRVKLPQRSDMICGFATLKGTAAMRNTKKGSWFIQELNAAVRQRARDTHLSDILVQVNGRIKEREGYAPGSAHHRCKEMSEFTSSLCKDLYLFPKYCPNN